MSQHIPLYAASGAPSHLHDRTKIRRLAKDLIAEIKAAEEQALSRPAARTFHLGRGSGVSDLYDASDLLHLKRAVETQTTKGPTS